MDSPHDSRILLVDRSPSIHDAFRQILTGSPGGAAVADGADPAGAGPAFALDTAGDGTEAVARVEAALAAGAPYAVAFIDMRDGDGMDTVQALWQLDARLQVVICTASPAAAWQVATRQLDAADRMLVLKKPFDAVEVRQLARTLAAKWTLARGAEARTRELETLAHTLAHDLRSPLARVSAFGQLLAEELSGRQDKAGHYLDRMVCNASVAESLIEGLLRLAEIAQAPLRLVPLQLGAVVQQVVSELRQAEPQRRVTVRVEPDLAVLGDAVLLPLAVRQLVENAWKFSAGQGHTLIEVGRADGPPGHCVHYVRDNGCGFDMADAGQLFQGFHRLHPPGDYSGAGVGLVTVGRVLARHCGRAWAQAAPGQGSTFYFSLPHPGQAAAAESPVLGFATRRAPPDGPSQRAW